MSAQKTTTKSARSMPPVRPARTRASAMSSAIAVTLLIAGASSAHGQSKAASQWTDPPPQRAHSAGFAIATVQWAVGACGGTMGQFFRESMTIFGQQHIRAFNLGHAEGEKAMANLAAVKGRDLGCRIVESLYGPKGESMVDGWIMAKAR